MRENKKVFITKFCLTKGILEYEMDITEDGEMATGRINGNYLVFFKKEFFFSKNEAIQDSSRRKERQLKSLLKKIDKLKSLQF